MHNVSLLELAAENGLSSFRQDIKICKRKTKSYLKTAVSFSCCWADGLFTFKPILYQVFFEIIFKINFFYIFINIFIIFWTVIYDFE
jgi:hypothetical protein